MSAAQIRSQLERKQAQHINAERKAGKYRSKESKKRADAAKARSVAASTKSAQTAKSKYRDADQRDREAESAGKEASRWQSRASGYAKEAAVLSSKLAKAIASEQRGAEQKRDREQKQRDRREAAANAVRSDRVTSAEMRVASLQDSLPSPKPEKLRVLILTSSGEGDLRVGREMRQIRAAVRAAVLRDFIELDLRPAATPSDLLDGITEFRPHVVHFSGHSDEAFVVFEGDTDAPNPGVAIPATVFARAIAAVDYPPSLVVFNSCNSESQAVSLVQGIIPFAIGMSDTVDDGHAIRYAARFYGAIANGQSIGGAHELARADLEMQGAAGHELPTLAVAEGLDARMLALVTGTV